MKFANILGIVLIAVVAYAAGVYWGDLGATERFEEMIATQKPAADFSKMAAGSGVTITPQAVVDQDFLESILEMTRDKYLRPEEIDSLDITYGAAQGMIAGVGDPHTQFLPPESAEDFLIAVDGELAGIGAEIAKNEDKEIIIFAPLPDSPAERAGLRAKDVIYAVDEKLMEGKSVQDAVEMIRGKAGTDVELYIKRDGDLIREPITITREQIHLESLLLDQMDDGTLDIQIIQFDEDTPRELSQKLQELTASGADITGVLLDLRSNVGGYFEGAISVAGEFVEPGTPIVIERGKEGTEKHVARGLARLQGLPLVILVDGGTASAAEILAGALQQGAAATLVGTQTFGKGTVQEVAELPDGSVLKITSAEWLLPDGTPVNKIGIEPDFVVEFEQEDFDNDFDRQKEEAQKILQSQISS